MQIVREEDDPFTYAYLKAMGRRLGVEVSVNTSLNVGSPIVQTPPQGRGREPAKAIRGSVLIVEDGGAWFAWPAAVPCPEAVKEWTCATCCGGHGIMPPASQSSVTLALHLSRH